MASKRNIKLLLLLLSLLFIFGYVYFKWAFPAPNLTPVANPIRDRATKDWNAQEQTVAKYPNKRVYFGDLHVHSKLSMDAYLTGNSTTPEDAYLFGKGNPLQVVGNKVQLKRPLDFMAVTDHSEFLGEVYTYQNKDSKRHHTFVVNQLKKAQAAIEADKNIGEKFRELAYSRWVQPKHTFSFDGFETVKTNWDVLIAAAEKYYEPGKFTTFAGYEWTSGLIAHCHRNIIFKDMKIPDYPLSSFELKDEQALWTALKGFKEQGATVMAIPHNSNLSRGIMFRTVKPDNTPIDAAYAQLRQDFEKLIEIHQHKGNSEVYADFWKNDEYAGFENYYEGALTRNSFVRDALKKGLELQATLGVNPFKYGLIGSTDTHNSTPGNTEENSGTPGNFAFADASAKVRSSEKWAISGDTPAKKIYEAINPGGLVAVWAEANTRSSIYNALTSKETYATSGGRMEVRFFGGYDFAPKYDSYEAMVADGYAKGVPMGGDLKPLAGVNKAPSFLIWATKDAESANLDKIQVVKGWYANGALEEKIFDVAVADNAKGATIDPKTGEHDRTKGATTLQTLWTDPEFNPAHQAFYYLRVLEIPTARWSYWDEMKYGVKYPETVPKTVQERAWSSPIWYMP